VNSEIHYGGGINPRWKNLKNIKNNIIGLDDQDLKGDVEILICNDGRTLCGFKSDMPTILKMNG